MNAVTLTNVIAVPAKDSDTKLVTGITIRKPGRNMSGIKKEEVTIIGEEQFRKKWKKLHSSWQRMSHMFNISPSEDILLYFNFDASIEIHECVIYCDWLVDSAYHKQSDPFTAYQPLTRKHWQENRSGLQVAGGQ